MSTVEMLFKVLLISKLLKHNLLLGNHNWNLNGQLIKIMMSLQDNFVDSHGNQITQNQNVLLELSIGLDSILMNTLEIL